MPLLVFANIKIEGKKVSYQSCQMLNLPTKNSDEGFRGVHAFTLRITRQFSQCDLLSPHQTEPDVCENMTVKNGEQLVNLLSEPCFPFL